MNTGIRNVVLAGSFMYALIFCGWAGCRATSSPSSTSNAVNADAPSAPVLTIPPVVIASPKPAPEPPLERLPYGKRYIKGNSMCQMFHYNNDPETAWEFCLDMRNHCKTVCPNANQDSWSCAHVCD